MPKVTGKVIKAGIKDGKLLCLLQMNGRIPKPDEWVICKWGRTRTLSQNALLWVFYDWLMDDCGLKDEYATSEELHETFKAAFLSKKHFTPSGKIILKIGSTTTLNKQEFSDFLEKINNALIDWNGIDTSPFWQEHKERFVA